MYGPEVQQSMLLTVEAPVDLDRFLMVYMVNGGAISLMIQIRGSLDKVLHDEQGLLLGRSHLAFLALRTANDVQWILYIVKFE